MKRKTMEVRLAVMDDLEEQYQVFAQSEGELCRQQGVAWEPEPFSQWRIVHEHLLLVDGERCYVATANGKIVGFSAAFRRQDVCFLSALFILPEYQNCGLGRRLCGLSLRDDAKIVLTITDSFQLVSTGLYAKWHLFPRTPIMTLSGRPAHIDPPPLEPGPLELADLLELDMACYGFDRSLDHALWQEGAHATLWRDRGKPVAYSYRSEDGKVGPIVGNTTRYAALALRGELNQLEGQMATLLVPGSSYLLMHVAFQNGLRYAAQPGLLLGNSNFTAPTSLAISGYWLM